MTRDPRSFDLLVRTITTALIALTIVSVAAVQAVRTGHVQPELAAWGGIIIGVFFGSHASLNGSGVRAARDQQLTQQLLEAQPTHVTAPDAPPAAGVLGG